MAQEEGNNPIGGFANMQHAVYHRTLEQGKIESIAAGRSCLIRLAKLPAPACVSR